MAVNYKCECKNIFDAIKIKHIVCIKKFPEQVNNYEDTIMMFPLEHALKNTRNFEVIRTLLEMGVTIRDHDLSDAVWFSRPRNVKLLLSYGANPNKIYDRPASTCLILALDCYFCDAGTINDDVADRYLLIIEMLITYGADCSYINEEFLNKTFMNPNKDHIDIIMNIIENVIPFKDAVYVYEDLKEPCVE